MKPLEHFPSPGGWTFWQLRLYRIAIAASIFLWTLATNQSLPQHRLTLAILALCLPSSTNLARIAATAILLALAAFIPNRDLPPGPLLATLLFAVLAGPAAFRLHAFLIVAQIAGAVAILNTHATSDWPWILLAIPALIPPGCIPAKRAPITATSPRQEKLFYDGHCGLCHHAVQFLLSEDIDGSRFRFAPLDSDSFRATVPANIRATLPNSVVVWNSTQQTALCKSRAAIHVLERLGGYWRVLALFAARFPAPLLDKAYDGIAGIRYRLFKRPADACPLMPKELRARFDY